MTAAEKQRFRGYFPGLDVDRAVVTGEASRVYNCISWTEKQMKEKTSKYVSAAQRKTLNEQVASVPATVRAEFERAFCDWKESWFVGGLAVNSDPHSRAVGREFDALIAMGPAILPLVVEKLTDPENFFALQLYDAMQPQQRLVVEFVPEDERILEGEQGRARRAVQAWFANQ